MMNFLKRLLRSQRGATAIEYGLIVTLIAIAVVSSMGLVATESTNKWNNVSSNFPTT